MKKIIPIILSLAFCFSLAACGGNNTTSSMMESGNTSDMLTSSKNESTSSNSILDASGVSSTSSDNTILKDGKYTAEGDSYDEDGYKPYVELTVKNGKITEIDCDAIDKEGDFKKESDDMEDWADKIMLFEKEVVAKGLEKITFNKDGTATGIDGMDLNVGEYGDLIKEAMDKAKK